MQALQLESGRDLGLLTVSRVRCGAGTNSSPGNGQEGRTAARAHLVSPVELSGTNGSPSGVVPGIAPFLVAQLLNPSGFPFCGAEQPGSRGTGNVFNSSSLLSMLLPCRRTATVVGIEMLAFVREEAVCLSGYGRLHWGQKARDQTKCVALRISSPLICGSVKSP